MPFVIWGAKNTKTTQQTSKQEDTLMQGESLKIVPNSSSCHKQLLGRKWSPEPLPFLPHSPLPNGDPPFCLIFQFFAPVNSSLPDFTTISSPEGQCTRDSPLKRSLRKGDPVHSLVPYGPRPHQASLTQAPLQHSCSRFVIPLPFLSPRTSQDVQKPGNIPVRRVSESTTRRSDTTKGQRQWKPRHFLPPPGAGLLFCSRL